MLDLRNYQQQEEEYEIFKDVDGTIIKVGLPTQKDLVRIGKFQFMIDNLQKEYNKLMATKKVTEKSFDDMERLNTKIVDIIYQLFLFIVNLNTTKEFALDDIKVIPYAMIQEECNNYMDFIAKQLKN